MKARPARMTATLVIGTCLCWLIIASAGLDHQVAMLAGFIPARLAGLASVNAAMPAWATPLSAALLHASLLHLGLNMLMLGYCGKATEQAIGSAGLAALYVVGAYAAAGAQYLANPTSPVPMIGASGAVSAIVGAYAMFHGRHRVVVSHPDVNRLLQVAWLAAGWIAIQLLIGFATEPDGAGIAIAAHIGGFVAGLLLARPLLLWRYRKA